MAGVKIDVAFTISPDQWYGMIGNFIPVALETYDELRAIAPEATFYMLWNDTRARLEVGDNNVDVYRRWSEARDTDR